MRYSKEQRIDIGRQVFTHEITPNEAKNKYGISDSSIDTYVSMYKLSNGIPTANARVNSRQKADKKQKNTIRQKTDIPSSLDIEAYQAMSKEELINELIKAKVNEARAKKGYEVKGDGANKEFISLRNKNSKS